MRRTRQIVAFGTITCSALLLISLITPTAASGRPRPRVSVLLSGLSSPKGLALASDGNLFLSQGAFGPPGACAARILPKGPDRGQTIEVTDPQTVTDVAEGPDGSGWAIGGDRVLYRQHLGGGDRTVLDIPAYQETDPDPFDQEGAPYGIQSLTDWASSPRAMPWWPMLPPTTCSASLPRATPRPWPASTSRSISTEPPPTRGGFPANERCRGRAHHRQRSAPTAGLRGRAQRLPVPSPAPPTDLAHRSERQRGCCCSANTPTARLRILLSEGRFTSINDIAFNLQKPRRFSTCTSSPPCGALCVRGGIRDRRVPPCGRTSEGPGVANARPGSPSVCCQSLAVSSSPVAGRYS